MNSMANLLSLLNTVSHGCDSEAIPERDPSYTLDGGSTTSMHLSVLTAAERVVWDAMVRGWAANRLA